MKFSLSALATAGLLLAAGGAQAALVGTDAGFQDPSVVTFDSFDGLLTSSPVDLGLGVELRSVFEVEIGANHRDLGDNGLWGARVGIETPTGSGHFLATADGPFGALVFMLDAPVAGFGAWFNQYQGYDEAPGNFTLLALDAFGNTLESYTVSVDTPWDGYNEGAFFGIHRELADIHGFTITGNDLVLDNLTLTTSPIPEPGSYALMALGLAAIGGLVRRRRAD